MAGSSTVVRANGSLLRKIDDYARSVERKTGVTVGRQAAAHALIKLGLRVASAERKR